MMSYEEWLVWLFDRDTSVQFWWYEVDFNWDESSNYPWILEHLTRLFTESSALQGIYSRAQIDQGFALLIGCTHCNAIFSLLDTDITWEKRRTCLEGIKVLYRDLFASVYGNDLGSSSSGGDAPTFSCFMLWDVSPFYPKMDHPNCGDIVETVFSIFEETLSLESEACLESVLHGLGHWAIYLPDRVKTIVQSFLDNRKDISVELREYAESAKVGMVL
jgi:hypothetical protein